MPASSLLSRFAVPLGLGVLGAVLAYFLVPSEMRSVDAHLLGFPDADTAAHQARPWILGIMCFLPALAAFAFACGSMMDRYIARQLVGIFGISLFAFIAIWVLMDLNDNLGDFKEGQASLRMILKFYLIRAPMVIVLLLPYTLLLSVLYSLSRLSRDREIVAMIQSGRGILRISVPLVIAGLFGALFCAAMNYHWAPTAEGLEDGLLDKLKGRRAAVARNVLYRSDDGQRIWLVGIFPKHYEKGAPLLDVEVTISNANHQIERRLSAKQASWNAKSRSWTFEEAWISEIASDRAPVFLPQSSEPMVFQWPETPMQIIRPGLSAPYLGVPDLNSWLKNHQINSPAADPAAYLTQWHYRWALPFTCLVTVLLATPLAIHFSRRGPGSGIFLAVVLTALMMLLSGVTLALGEAGTIPPILGAWLPNFVFTGIALYFFKLRESGQPIYQMLMRLIPTQN